MNTWTQWNPNDPPDEYCVFIVYIREAWMHLMIKKNGLYYYAISDDKVPVDVIADAKCWQYNTIPE